MPIVFVSGGEEVSVEAEVGKSILEVAHANDIELEGAQKHRSSFAAAHFPPRRATGLGRCVRWFACMLNVPCHPGAGAV